MNKSASEILTNIIQLRVKKKVTQKELGLKLGITESAYNKIENGKTEISYLQLSKISSALDMSVLDLIAYPDTCTVGKLAGKSSPRVVLQVELENDVIKSDVITLAFGDRILKINNDDITISK